jgi:sulfite exporter TauE/SafE
MNIYATINNNFWGVLFTSKLGFSESQISTFAALRSLVMTFGFFVIGPRLTNLRRFRLPLGVGFGAFLLSQGLLVLMPAKATALLALSVVLEGAASSLVSPMAESLLSVSMETDERARLTAMVSMAMIILISPFGWIAGQLSAMNRSFPFLLNIALFAVGLVIVWIIGKPGLISFVKHTEPHEV